MNQAQRRQYLIRSLLKENPAYHDWGVPQEVDDQKRLLRGLMNVRPAQSSDAEFLKIQDKYRFCPFSRAFTSGRATLRRFAATRSSTPRIPA